MPGHAGVVTAHWGVSITSPTAGTAETRVPGPETTSPASVEQTGAAQPGTVQSVVRAMRLLEFVAAGSDGVSAKDIAAHLDLALPSTYHLLATFVESGYLVHLARNHRYGLGYRVRLLEQGLIRQLYVPRTIVHAIRHLFNDARAPAYYAVYRDVEVVLAHVVDSDELPRVNVLDVGFHEATHATAFGKVMLAAMSRDERRAYLARAGLRRCTSRTIVDPDTLETHLSHVRDSGVALEIGEFQDGLSCLASPVRSGSGAVVASVAISLPSEDFAQRRWELERAVRHGALVATRALRAESA
jgi:DNA-binding IclR family transcriptional regulator